MLSAEIVEKCRESYLGNYTNDSDPYLSPLEATLNSELPPALLFTAQCDPLRDEAKLYAKKLKDSGVDVTYIEYEGMIHGFLSFYMVLKEARQALELCGQFIEAQPEK